MDTETSKRVPDMIFMDEAHLSIQEFDAIVAKIARATLRAKLQRRLERDRRAVLERWSKNR